jgi:hypothetical protein
MRTIYLSTLNSADKEFFLTFLYIASLGQAWQNPSDTNSRVGLRALISPTRSDINPRVGFELLSETQPYGQANFTRRNSLDVIVDQKRHLSTIFKFLKDSDLIYEESIVIEVKKEMKTKQKVNVE